MRDTGWVRTAAASLVICAAGGALLWGGTDGFRALTTEQARRNAIARAPRTLPEFALEDQDGRPFSLADYRRRLVAVDFVYTQCKSVCPLLSVGFQRIDREQRSRASDERVQLVSITFDPRDTPALLRDYASRYGADGRTWRLARVRDTTQLTDLLRAFEIVVIAEPGGDFQHNAAVHLLDVNGRLARLLDPGATLEAIDASIGVSTQTTPSRVGVR